MIQLGGDVRRASAQPESSTVSAETQGSMKRLAKLVLRGMGYEISRIESSVSREYRGHVMEFVEQSVPIRFLVSNKNDLIQSRHHAGGFYEPEELEIISRYFRRKWVFVDIGANVGNHSVFAGRVLGASKVIAFEPSPASFRTLEINLALNGLDGITTVYMAGVSDRDGVANLHCPDENNLGRSIITDSAQGVDISILRGDRVLADQHVDFMKIDVEGHEIQCMKGLSLTVERCKPVIFVEVDNHNLESFVSLIEEFGYVVLERFRRYPGNENFLISPR